MSPLPDVLRRKIDAVCAAFAAAWQTAARPKIVDYLVDLGTVARSHLLRALLVIDAKQRIRHGECPAGQDYAAQFPGEDGTIAAAIDEARLALRGEEDSAPAGRATGELPSEARLDTSPGAAAEPKVEIAVVEGPHAGRHFTIEGHDSFIVGRSRFAHFRLPQLDPYFSRFHFLIEANPPCCRLMDLDSTNGTRVNGAAIASVELRDGDLIQGGGTAMKVSLQGDWRGVAPAPVETSASSLAGTHAVLGPTEAFVAAPIEPPVAAPPTDDIAASSAAAPIPFPQIAGYEVHRELGRGGMGIVYLATRLADQEKVAIKTVRPTVAARPQETERFLREARILARLRHPHIVSFLESGQIGNLLYFVMEYVDGTDTFAMLRSQGRLPLARGVGLLCQALEALDYAHREGFVHRDVKPANLLVTTVGGRECCRLADFGLARVYQASSMSGLTIMGDIGGTVAYMPPEQITHYRDAQPPADQYAAAATLYHLLTGHLIFDFANVPQQKQLAMILGSAPVPISERCPDVPRALAAAIGRALDKQPQRRFPAAAAFRAALLPFA